MMIVQIYNQKKQKNPITEQKEENQPLCGMVQTKEKILSKKKMTIDYQSIIKFKFIFPLFYN